MVKQALGPGMSTAALAMRNQVKANQLRRWVMLHQSAGSAPAPMLLPVTVAAPTAPWASTAHCDQAQAVEIDVAGWPASRRHGVTVRVRRSSSSS